MGVSDDHHSEHSKLSPSKQPATSENSNSSLQRNKSKERTKNSSLCEVTVLDSFADAYRLHLIRRAEDDSDSEEELPNSGIAAHSRSNCSSTSETSRSLSPLVIIRSSNSTRSTREASFDKLLQSKSNEFIQNETDNNSKNEPSVKIHSKTGRNKDAFNSTSPEAKLKNELTDSSKVKKGFHGSEKITNRFSTPHLSLRGGHECPRRVYRSTPHPRKTKHVEGISHDLLNSKSGCPTIASLPNFLSDQTSPSVTKTTLIKSQDIISKTKSSCIAGKGLLKRKESNKSVADKEHGSSNDKSNKQRNSSDTNSEDSFYVSLTKRGIEEECIALSNVKRNSLPLNSNRNEDKLSKNMQNKESRYSAFSDEEFVFSDSEEEREYDKNTVFGKLAVKVNDYKNYLSPTNNNADKKTQRHYKRKSENNNEVIQNKRAKNGHANCLNPNFIFRLYSFLDEVSKSQQFKEAGERLKKELENNLPCLGLQILTYESDAKSNDRMSSGSSYNLSDAENCVSQIPKTNEPWTVENYQQEQIQNKQEIVKEAFKQPMQPRLKKSVRGREKTKRAKRADKDENSSGKRSKSKDPLMKQKHSRNPKSLIINTDPLATEESNTVRRSTRFRCPTGYEVKSSGDGQNELVRRSTYLPVERLLTKKEAEALRKNRHKNTSRKKSILSNNVSSQNSQVVEHQESSLQQRSKRKLYDASDWLHSSALQSLCIN